MTERWDYEGDLEKARGGGLIQGTTVNDASRQWDFPYLETGFAVVNSRDLAQEMESLLILMKDEEGMYGELGGGIGKALSDVSRMMERTGTPHRLVNISTTPVDPFVRLNFSLKSGLGAEPQVLLSDSGQELNRGKIETPDDLLDIQARTRTKVVRRLDQPYIHDQRVGVFPKNVDLSGLKKQFLWLYDRLGAFHYTCHEENRAEVYDTINKLVADNGVFLSMDSYVSKDEAKEMHSYCQEGDVILVGYNDLLLMRKDSLVLAYFSKKFPDLFKDGEVIFTPNFREIMSDIRKELRIPS